MRLDKFVAAASLMTRSQAKEAIKKGRVTVEGKVLKDASQNITETAVLTLDGKPIVYNKFVYLMLNKPAGFICATEDGRGQPTVSELIGDYAVRELFSVGRLDKDTVGLLIMTNNGTLAHELLSPKKHVSKKYLLNTDIPFTVDDINAVREGIVIEGGYKTLPAELEIFDEKSAYITLHEGKFHQIKLMMKALGKNVTFLERVKFAGIPLDRNLERGQWRLLSEKEIAILEQR